MRDVQDCQQRLRSTFDLLLIFLCSLIQTLTPTPPPNNALLANLGHVWEKVIKVGFLNLHMYSVYN